MRGLPIGDAVEATDPEDDPLTYSLGDAPGSTDATSFAIDRNTGQLRTMAPLNFETKSSYEVMVRVTDNKNAAGTSDSTIDNEIEVTITVDDENEAPMFTEGDMTTRSIEENSADEFGAPVVEFGAPVVATDPDDDDTLRYSLGDVPGSTDASLFTIAGGQLSATATFNYEASPIKRTYTVTVIATDNDSLPLADTIMVTITVTNVNEAPTFLNAPSVASASELYVYEGAAGKMVFDPDGELKATDEDAGDTDTLRYGLSGAGAGSFNINRNTGKLTSTAALSHSATPADNEYTVTVTATDRGGLSHSTDVTIEVKSVTSKDNKKPKFDPAAVTRTVAENTDPGLPIGQDAPVEADEDANETETYTYTLGGSGAPSFDIDIDTGQLRTKAALDHETKDTYTVTVTANDGTDDSENTATVTITVTDVAESPVFEEGERTVRRVDENTAAGQNIGDPVVATDSDGDTVTYTLGGTHASSFELVTGTGQLRTKTGVSLDHETEDKYTVTVTATDSSSTSNTGTITVTIIVEDVKEKPVFVTSDTNSDPITSASRTVAEDTEAGESIESPVLAEDDDEDPLEYSLHGDDRASFDIDSTTGQLKTMAMLDYETKHSYSVTVRVEDGRGSSGRAEIPVTITVTDVVGDETPMFSTASLTPQSGRGYRGYIIE